MAGDAGPRGAAGAAGAGGAAGVTPEEFTAALYGYLARTPAMLIGVSLAEAVGERRPQNLPGTVDEYPNWRIPLADGRRAAPVLLEDLPGHAGRAGRGRGRCPAAWRGAQRREGDKVHAWLPAMNWTSCPPANCTTCAVRRALHHLDVEFLWELLRAIPAAEASEGHDDEAGRDITQGERAARRRDRLRGGRRGRGAAAALPRLPGQARGGQLSGQDLVRQ